MGKGWEGGRTPGVAHRSVSQRYGDPLLPKPDRAGSLPAAPVSGAARARCGVVRGCPLETGQDRCEWHASGTAGEYDIGTAPHAGSTVTVA